MALPMGHYIRDVNVQDSAHAHFGDQYFTGGLTTVNAKGAPLNDYNGLYAYNALAPVSTYVDRTDLRRQLEAQLHDRIEHIPSKTPIVVVQGIGGVGKTQLVLDYIRRYRHDYSGVFWIEVGRPEANERDYVQIYSLLHNVRQEAGEARIALQHAVTAVKSRFYERGRRALFVFDNADSIRDPNDPCYIDLRRFLPDDGNSHVILTTRDRLALELSELPAVEVDEMTPEEAAQLFQKQAKLTITTPQQQQQVDQIVQTLGYLALAITLAASYVAVTPRLQRDLASYLLEYQERRKDLLAQRPTRLIHQYGQSVLTTWETTFAAMEAQHPEACQFLELLSFFNHDDIPSTFPIELAGGGLPSWVSVLLPGKQISKYDIEAFFRILTSFSFLKYREDQHSYTMHSLVQAWAYDRLTLNQQQRYCYVGVLVLKNMACNEEIILATRACLVPHVLRSCYRISELFESAPAEGRAVIAILVSLSKFLYDCGYVEEVLLVRRSTLLKCQLWYGEDDVDTLRMMHRLAFVLNDSGQPREALTIIGTALEKQQQILRADDPAIQQSRQVMAWALWDLGEQEEALSIQREVLKTQQQILGDDSIHMLRAEYDLADMLAEMGHLQAAIPMKRVSVGKHRRILGPDHYHTLFSIHDLAITLIDARDPRGALPLVRDVVERSQEVLGENHPDTLSSMSTLARVLCDLREFDEALWVQQDTVKRAEKYLKSDHRVRRMVMKNLNFVESEITRAGMEEKADEDAEQAEVVEGTVEAAKQAQVEAEAEEEAFRRSGQQQEAAAEQRERSRREAGG